MFCFISIDGTKIIERKRFVFTKALRERERERERERVKRKKERGRFELSLYFIMDAIMGFALR